MRFLEFVFWCGSATQLSEVQTTTSSQRLVDDEGSLVPLSPRTTRHRKKSGRLATTANTPEWRPSLRSISEDHIVQPRERGDTRNRKMEPEREVKRRNADGSAAGSKAHHRNYRDDHKRLAAATVMPAFSPTPFMF